MDFVDKIGDFIIMGSLAVMGWATSKLISLDHKVEELKTHMAQTYVNKEDYQHDMDRLFDKLDNIDRNIMDFLNK